MKQQTKGPKETAVGAAVSVVPLSSISSNSRTLDEKVLRIEEGNIIDILLNFNKLGTISLLKYDC